MNNALDDYCFIVRYIGAQLGSRVFLKVCFLFLLQINTISLKLNYVYHGTDIVNINLYISCLYLKFTYMLVRIIYWKKGRGSATISPEHDNGSRI